MTLFYTQMVFCQCMRETTGALCRVWISCERVSTIKAWSKLKAARIRFPLNQRHVPHPWLALMVSFPVKTSPSWTAICPGGKRGCKRNPPTTIKWDRPRAWQWLDRDEDDDFDDVASGWCPPRTKVWWEENSLRFLFTFFIIPPPACNVTYGV